MTNELIHMRPVAHVMSDRTEPTDDYWGGVKSIIRIDGEQFDKDATEGLGDFSHLEVLFHFHRTPVLDINTLSRRPRDNPDWPMVGIFGHRNMRRPNRLAASRCRLVAVDGLDLHVEELDAIDGTPVLDIKPWFVEFGPRGSIHQATWSTDMLRDYFAKHE